MLSTALDKRPEPVKTFQRLMHVMLVTDIFAARAIVGAVIFIGCVLNHSFFNPKRVFEYLTAGI